jgi:N-acetylmuramoyl-L-alanine amidase
MKPVAAMLLMFASTTSYALSRSEVDCVAYAVYHEARGESEKGWAWVVDVIQNRSKSGKYPKNPCAVITQHAQFSFWKGRRTKIKNKALYFKIFKLVKAGRWRGVSKGSMWYHAKYVKPKWRKRLVRVASIGEHIFYKERRVRT